MKKKKPAKKTSKSATAAPRRNKRVATALQAKIVHKRKAVSPDLILSLLKDIHRDLAPVSKEHAELSAIEAGVSSIRRVLSEMLDSKFQSVAFRLAEIKGLMSSDNQHVHDLLDALLEDTGATRFAPERLDYFDPLIHMAVRESSDLALPAGVVSEVVTAGYKVPSGKIICRAKIVLNRRS